MPKASEAEDAVLRRRNWLGDTWGSHLSAVVQGHPLDTSSAINREDSVFERTNETAFQARQHDAHLSR